MMNDTAPDIHHQHVQLLREAGPQRRLEMAMQLTQRTIAAARDALRRAHPDLSARQHNLLWVRLNYGQKLATELESFLQACDHQNRDHGRV